MNENEMPGHTNNIVDSYLDILKNLQIEARGYIWQQYSIHKQMVKL